MLTATRKRLRGAGTGNGRAQLAGLPRRRHPMAMTSSALRKELFQLPTAEKLELVEELWDSISEEDDSL